MKASKILSVVVSAAMLGSYAGTAAFAADDTGAKNYNYVALGDSIAAGFGLAGGDLAEDPALTITEELLANPVQGAYPAVFTDYLQNLGEEKGFNVKGTNLASTAYRAEDIENTIKIPGNKGEFAANILERFVGEGASDVLIPYHDYYTKYLAEADLVSIQLGGNDIVMSIIPQMVFGDNPILQAAGTSLMLTLFGMDTQTAIGGGLQILIENKDNITSDDFIEAAVYMYNVSQMADQLVDDSASHVKGVVEAVKELNGNADIALLGMFNPYRTDESAAATEDDIYEVLGKIYAEAAKLAAASEGELTVSGKQSTDYIENLTNKANQLTELKEVMDKYNDEAELGELLAMVENYDDISELEELAAIMEATEGNPAQEDILALMLKYDDISELQEAIDLVKNYDDVSELTELMAVMAKYRTANEAAAEKAIAEEIAAPIAMKMAGKNVDPQIQRLNKQLQVVAEETGAIYVDVYDISPEDDFDPHPNENGHKEIAGILYDNLYDLICERNGVAEEPQETDAEEVSDVDNGMLGDVNSDGAITSTDFLMIAAHVFGVRPLTDAEMKYADIDGSGSIDLMDALILAAYINMFSK
ncbi:MAG: dockerin [Ruminococcus sp.]|uniref:dockerin type I domain-containing protein n=1 Tax=Ruminococcus sp. TaxID=41978 RepID=UPI0025E1CEB6|nr:dockerin type I domain-containing protein [Ruminococcus sp.]MBR5682392.1 dockerin [Ruminococcus sp.]